MSQLEKKGIGRIKMNFFKSLSLKLKIATFVGIILCISVVVMNMLYSHSVTIIKNMCFPIIIYAIILSLVLLKKRIQYEKNIKR
jgi:hypothetical protein